MIKNILIASATETIEGKTWQDLYTQVCIAASSMDCTVLGGIVTSGPGCINMGLKVHAINETQLDTFGKALCMAMMPAKWGNTNDEIKDGFIDNLTGY